jgi:hypothetical protein
MLVGILIILGAGALLAFATWMHRRDEDDEGGTIIWSLVQVMCVFVMMFGAFMIYQAVAMPPKPPSEGAGF